MRRWCAGAGLRGGHLSPGGARFGRGTGPLRLDQVRCSGVEWSLAQCSHAGWLIHNCVHREDAGVICSGKCLSLS